MRWSVHYDMLPLITHKHHLHVWPLLLPLLYLKNGPRLSKSDSKRPGRQSVLTIEIHRQQTTPVRFRTRMGVTVRDEEMYMCLILNV